jgi:hypothetical protein
MTTTTPGHMARPLTNTTTTTGARTKVAAVAAVAAVVAVGNGVGTERKRPDIGFECVGLGLWMSILRRACRASTGVARGGCTHNSSGEWRRGDALATLAYCSS